jgi:hypothetical protein
MPINNTSGLRVAMYSLIPASCFIGAAFVAPDKISSLQDVIADISHSPLFGQTVRAVQEVGEDLAPVLEVVLSRFNAAISDGFAMGCSGYHGALSMLPIVEVGELQSCVLLD